MGEVDKYDDGEVAMTFGNDLADLEALIFNYVEIEYDVVASCKVNDCSKKSGRFRKSEKRI